MDYCIDFSAAEAVTIVTMKRRLIGRSWRISEQDGLFSIDDTIILRPVVASRTAVEISGMTDD